MNAPPPAFRADLQRAAALARLLAPYRGKLLFAVSLFLVGRSAALLIPLASARIIDQILPRADRVALDRVILIVIGLTLLAIATSLAKDVAVSRVTNSLVINLRGRMQETLQSISVPTLQRWKPGYWISRLDGDVNSFSMLSGETAVSLMEDVVSIVLATSLILYTSATMSTLLLFFVPLLVLSAVILSRRMTSVAQKNRERWGKYMTFLEDEIRSTQLVKALGVQQRRKTRGERLLRLAGRADLSLVLKNRALSATTSVVALFLPVAVLWFGMRQVMDGDLTLGRFVAFNTYLVYVTSPINHIVALLRQFRVSSVSFDRIRDVLNLERETADPSRAIDRFRCAIEIDGLGVRYDDGRVALDAVSALIPRGSHVAVVGPNGSGKSTLLRALQGYCRPTSGRVLFDGAECGALDQPSLRRLLGYVPAGSLLLDGTLRENLTFGTTAAQAAELPRLLDETSFFEGTGLAPADLDRRISEVGARLSDGQRQLVALIRMLLRQPEIAIIDEGMSFLDGVNHHRIMEVLRRKLSQTTLLWATHSYDQIEEFDTVMVLRNGHLESFGSLETALAESPWFQDVFSRRREASNVGEPG